MSGKTGGRAGSKDEERGGGAVGKKLNGGGVSMSQVGLQVLVAMGFSWEEVTGEVSGKAPQGVGWQEVASNLAWRAGGWGQEDAGGELSEDAREEEEALKAIYGDETFKADGHVWRVVVDAVCLCVCVCVCTYIHTYKHTHTHTHTNTHT